jgi:hypothetical protein
MADDFLRQAAAALREEHDGKHPNPQATRQRILAAAAKRESARRRTVILAMPLAATFVLFAAWAGATGRISSIVQAVESTFSGASQEDRTEKSRVAAGGGPGEKAGTTGGATPSAPAETPEAPAPEASANLEPPTPPSPAETAPVVEPAPKAAPSGGAPRTTASAHADKGQRHDEPIAAQAPTRDGIPAFPSSGSTDPAVPSAIANEPGAALYMTAHQVHFVEKDPARAVQAWDAYLQAAPNGRFAPEARYNRAIMLVRLGRREDAIRELRPFADGTYGSYRQADARALINALESPDAAP